MDKQKHKKSKKKQITQKNCIDTSWSMVMAALFSETASLQLELGDWTVKPTGLC